MNKVLVVEDDDFLRGIITRRLTKEGFNVSEAIDGKQAVRKIKELKPDIVLLDLILPELDGFGVLSEIKHDPRSSSIPVIILSNLGQAEDVEKGLKLGAADFLIKANFTPAEIVEKVKDILKKFSKNEPSN